MPIALLCQKVYDTFKVIIILTDDNQFHYDSKCNWA